MSETEEVHVISEPQAKTCKDLSTSKKAGDGFSEEEVPHPLGGKVLWLTCAHATSYANVGARCGNFLFVSSSPSCVLGIVDTW